MSARVRERDTHCWLCLEELAPGLAYPHPRSTTVHHIVPITLDGAPLDPRNLVAVHKLCNEKVGARIVTQGHLRKSSRKSALNPSRAW